MHSGPETYNNRKLLDHGGDNCWCCCWFHCCPDNTSNTTTFPRSYNDSYSTIFPRSYPWTTKTNTTSYQPTTAPTTISLINQYRTELIVISIGIFIIIVLSIFGIIYRNKTTKIKQNNDNKIVNDDNNQIKIELQELTNKNTESEVPKYMVNDIKPSQINKRQSAENENKDDHKMELEQMISTHINRNKSIQFLNESRLILPNIDDNRRAISISPGPAALVILHLFLYYFCNTI